LTLRGRVHGDAVEIAVIDTGIGSAPADLGRITEPLYSTKARGLDLGLALVRMILERNGADSPSPASPARGAPSPSGWRSSTKET
jgi:nitrogen fixation/metabolism regulation signal transduction histidine kinase